MYDFLQKPWIWKIANCFCPLMLSTCHNGVLLITPPPPLLPSTHTYIDHSLCFKKIRTTTTPFLTSKTVVPNPYSHSNFCTHTLTLSSFGQICLSLIFNTLHLQIGNVILQCLNRNWTAIFKNRFVVNGQYIRFTTLLLISIYQKW